MKRGDVVVVVAPGDYGKARPAVIVQTDLLNDTHQSVAVCLFSSTLIDAVQFRVDITPHPANSLDRPSQIMVDKIIALPKRRIGRIVGRISDDELEHVDQALAFVLGLAE